MIDWGSPYSLNLTNVEPDATYCVDIQIFNDSASYIILLWSVCDLLATEYIFHPDDPTPCERYKIVITPVNAAGNGTTSHIVADYFMQQGDNSMYAC